MAMTLAQKILQMHTDEEIREPGQIVECSLSGVLANDITGPLAIKSFRAMGAKKVFDKDRVFLVMDHYTPQKDIASANQVIVSRRFAKEMGITHYYEGGCAGVEHALLPAHGGAHAVGVAHVAHEDVDFAADLRRQGRVFHGPRLHGHRLRHGARQAVVQGACHHPGEH